MYACALRKSISDTTNTDTNDQYVSTLECFVGVSENGLLTISEDEEAAATGDNGGLP